MLIFLYSNHSTIFYCASSRPLFHQLNRWNCRFVFLSYPRLQDPRYRIPSVLLFRIIIRMCIIPFFRWLFSREEFVRIIFKNYPPSLSRPKISRSRCRHVRRQLMPPPPPLMLQVVPISKEGETENKKTTHWHHNYDDVYIRVRPRIYTYVRACIRCSVYRVYLYVSLYTYICILPILCASTCSSVYSYFIYNYINFVLYVHKYIRTYLYIPIWNMCKYICRHARTRSCVCICYIYK